MPDERQNRIYQFGEFHLDIAERRLLRGQTRVQLSPRTFALLVKLVENAGHLLEKETLINEVWADSVVEEGNLNRTISNLRKALGEKPDENRFIETVPRAGYRFIAPVFVVEREKSESETRNLQSEIAEDQKPKTEDQNTNQKSKIKNQKSKWLVSALILVLVCLAFGAIAWRNWRQSASASKTGEIKAEEPVRLTDNPNHDTHPRWTRDGRIRFLRIDSNRNAESLIMNADGSVQTVVRDFPNLKYGFWSPDGRKVIFAKPNDRTAFYLANADGSDEITLPFFAGNFDWSPDSGRIVYQKTVEPNNPEIFVYSLDTKESLNITNNEHFDADPTFSPDGRQIAFVSGRDGNGEIYLANADGGDLRRLTNNASVDSHPVFSPDGTQIAFSSDREKENSDIYLLNTDGSGGAINLTNWEKSGESILPGGFSPDGTRIAFTSDRNGKDDIYVMSAEVFRPQIVLADAEKNLNSPAYSPDGKQFVYQAEREDKSGELRIFDLETRQSRLLLETENASLSPVFSPAGDWIAFQNRIEGNTEICLIRPDGSSLKNLTRHPARDLSPAFSPDGKQIVFTSNRDGSSQIFQLYLMNTDGTNQRRIYYSNAISAAPVWSPDGKQIVFANDKEDNRTGNFEIFLLEPETGEAERRLTFRRRFDTQPSFSPDGRRIAFVSETDGNAEIYVMNRDGAGLKRLTRNLAEDSSPRWSPDGKSLIFASNRQDNKFALFSIALD